MSGKQMIIVTGNLGRDSEIKYTQGGQALCSFSIAVSESWTDKNSGEKRERTTWHACTLWGERAEKLHTYLTKGKQVQVFGTAEASAYLDKSGQPAASLNVKVNDLVLLGSKGENGSHADEPPAPKEEVPF